MVVVEPRGFARAGADGVGEVDVREVGGQVVQYRGVDPGGKHPEPPVQLGECRQAFRTAQIEREMIAEGNRSQELEQPSIGFAVMETGKEVQVLRRRPDQHVRRSAVGGGRRRPFHAHSTTPLLCGTKTMEGLVSSGSAIPFTWRTTRSWGPRALVS